MTSMLSSPSVLRYVHTCMNQTVCGCGFQSVTFHDDTLHLSLPPSLPPSLQIQEFGKTETKDLKENGRQMPVTEANKREYVQLACQMKMTESIKAQIKSFLEGFYEVIPKELISIFNEQELELLISGLPTIDIDDLKANSEYRNYQESSLQVSCCFQLCHTC